MNDAAKRKAKKRQKPTPDEEASIRVDALFEEAAKFCAAVGLHKNMMHEIYDAENDWTFILKIDARLKPRPRNSSRAG